MSLTNEDITKITEAMRPIIREEIHRGFEQRLSELQKRLSGLLQRIANSQIATQ